MKRHILVACALGVWPALAIAQPSATPESYGAQIAPRAPVQAMTDGGGTNYIAGYLNPTTITKTVMFQNKGRIGIGTTNPIQKLAVAGDIGTNGALRFLGINGTGIVFGDGSIQTKAATPIVAPFTLTGSSATEPTFRATNTGGGAALRAESPDGVAFSANSTNSVAISAISTGTFGVIANCASPGGGVGVSAQGSGGPEAVGVSGYSPTGSGIAGFSDSGYAGRFEGKVLIQGNLQVVGSLSKQSGTFKIDHPLDPANKFLSHSFVESPDMMNVYNGNITTDAKGFATVVMPSYFSALNTDFRYQLTPLGRIAGCAVVQEIKNNRFVIQTDKPHVKVSWQVTGVRRDAYARDHRVQVEEPKRAGDKGKYLYPAGFDAPKSKQIGGSAVQIAKK